MTARSARPRQARGSKSIRVGQVGPSGSARWAAEELVDSTGGPGYRLAEARADSGHRTADCPGRPGRCLAQS
jgi:hypothetical protein